MKKLLVVLAALAALAVAGRGVRAPARQLHDQPLQPDRGLRAPHLRALRRWTWPRSPPSRPGRSTRRPTRADRRRRRLGVDGRPLELVPLRTALAHPPGAAGLQTTRLEVILGGPRLPRAGLVLYHDNNYRDRIGWKEIVVGAERRRARSDELRAYPKDLLQSPLDETRRAHALAPTQGPTRRRRSRHGRDAPGARPRRRLRLRSLIGRDHLSALVILASLAAALFWGAAHALSPGHGKTIVAAYLVGRRGTPWHAALLGLIVTATHTVGVFALGLVTLALSQFVVPEQLYPWLNLASGLLVVGIGGSVLAARARHRLAHAHGHEHHHHHHHGHDHEAAPGFRSLARGRGLRRPASLPLGARRPARRDLAAPGRVRDAPDRRVQRRPRALDHRRRPRRRLAKRAFGRLSADDRALHAAARRSARS